MESPLKRKLALGAIVAATAAFAGGAYAAVQSSNNPREAFLGDVAKRLNVSPQKLSAAMNGAFLDQLQAAVKAGRLTQAQADAIKKRMQRGGGPPFGPRWGGPGRGPHMVHGGPMAAAASYLGLTERQLFDQLAGGKSLAQIASAQGKSVAGLKAAMTASLKSRLDKLVAAKAITSAQAARALSEFTSHVDEIINHTGGRFGARGRGHFVPGGPGGPDPGGRGMPLHPMFGGGAVPPAGPVPIP